MLRLSSHPTEAILVWAVLLMSTTGYVEHQITKDVEETSLHRGTSMNNQPTHSLAAYIRDFSQLSCKY